MDNVVCWHFKSLSTKELHQILAGSRACREPKVCSVGGLPGPATGSHIWHRPGGRWRARCRQRVEMPLGMLVMYLSQQRNSGPLDIAHFYTCFDAYTRGLNYIIELFVNYSRWNHGFSLNPKGMRISTKSSKLSLCLNYHTQRMMSSYLTLAFYLVLLEWVGQASLA